MQRALVPKHQPNVPIYMKIRQLQLFSLYIHC
jgi:hypothetical protein